MEEIWKDVKGWEGLYQVSSLGRVRSLKRCYKAEHLRHNPEIVFGGNILNGRFDRDGYKKVYLRKKGSSLQIFVHRLVALTFIPNPENKSCVDHINCVRDDNRVENLRWVTPKENQNNEITKQRLNKHKRKAVIISDLKGNPLKAFPSASEASSIMKCSVTHLMNACRNRGVFKGYKWEYGNPDASLFDASIPSIKLRRVRPILQMDENGTKIAEFINIKEAAKKYGYSEWQLNDAIHGRKRMAYGYIWKYADDRDALAEAQKQIEMYAEYL